MLGLRLKNIRNNFNMMFYPVGLPLERQQQLRRDNALYLRCSASMFYKIWRETKDLSRIRVRKYLRFSKCNTCVKLRKGISPKFTGTSEAKQKLRRKKKRKLRKHIDDVKLERAAYWGRRRRACVNPKETMSIIIDGADVRNNGVPFFFEKTYAMQSTFKIGVHVFGVLVHGSRPFLYLVQDHVKLGKSAPSPITHQPMNY